MTLGQVLRQLRSEHKMTQRELADVFKISESTIGMYERDKREPDFETLEAIADYFNVDMDYLMGRSDIRRAHEYKSRVSSSGDDTELREYLEMLRSRPECRALLSTVKGATKAEVEENVRFIEALRQSRHD